MQLINSRVRTWAQACLTLEFHVHMFGLLPNRFLFSHIIITTFFFSQNLSLPRNFLRLLYPITFLPSMNFLIPTTYSIHLMTTTYTYTTCYIFTGKCFLFLVRPLRTWRFCTKSSLQASTAFRSVFSQRQGVIRLTWIDTRPNVRRPEFQLLLAGGWEEWNGSVGFESSILFIETSDSLVVIKEK